ncbi:MAG: hypothetical protein IPP01_13330 [Saprospiraceae bacterium]|nr:hypothetical protein [Saprospiraceae bacterium]
MQRRLFRRSPTTSIHGVKGYWTPQLNNQQSTMYTFHVIGDQCVTDSTKKFAHYSK